MHSIPFGVSRSNVGKCLKNLDSVDDGRANLLCGFDAFLFLPILTDNLRQVCNGALSPAQLEVH